MAQQERDQAVALDAAMIKFNIPVRKFASGTIFRSRLVNAFLKRILAHLFKLGFQKKGTKCYSNSCSESSQYV